ncbi:MAG: hypothetical protein AAFY65_08370 [Pseudomonadota bacterium]
MTIDQPDASEMFSLQLARHEGPEPLRVITAEVSRRGFRHRLMFGEMNLIEDVLQPDLAGYLVRELGKVTDTSPRIIEKPDLALPLPGLMLGKMRLIIGHNGLMQNRVIIRFKYFIGGLQNAFATKCYFDRPALEHRDEIGVRALEDVAMPLLNIANFSRAQAVGTPAPQDGSDGVGSVLGGIEAQATELEFYASLLRRYVQECGPSRTREVETFVDPVSRIMEMSESPNLYQAAVKRNAG